MPRTSNCTCTTAPGSYCRIHGCPHDGIVLPLPLNPRGCDCFARKAELRSDRTLSTPTGTATPIAGCLQEDVRCPSLCLSCDRVFEQPATEVDMVNHPPHYTSHPSGVECIEIKRHLGSDVGDAFKYVFRTDLKNGRQDVEKARFYLRDALDHGVAIFLPSWNFRVQQKLDRVIDEETDPNRLLFFHGIKRGDLSMALRAVELMLDSG